VSLYLVSRDISSLFYGVLRIWIDAVREFQVSGFEARANYHLCFSCSAGKLSCAWHRVAWLALEWSCWHVMAQKHLFEIRVSSIVTSVDDRQWFDEQLAVSLFT